jgi:MFS family permease
MFGLRSATALAGLVMVAGCILSAAAPDVGLFLTGRLIQGLGSGWISGFAMVAIALLFPERHLARVFAAVTFVWGIATVLGPLFGGLVLEGGAWRDVFWLFAAQAGLFSLGRARSCWAGPAGRRRPGIPGRSLGVLGLGVGAIAVANVLTSPPVAIALVVGAWSSWPWSCCSTTACGCACCRTGPATSPPSSAPAMPRCSR